MDEQATMSDKGTNGKASANNPPAKAGTVRHYIDERIDVSYDATRCIHAAACVHGLPAVFDTTRRPWILTSGGDADAIATVVARCPTGALHATRLDGGAAEDAPGENSIVPTTNGPLYLRGRLQLQTPEGDVTLDDVRMALCRCGQSQNKPFCDNSHRAAEFRDPGAIAGANAVTRPIGPGPTASSPMGPDPTSAAPTDAGPTGPWTDSSPINAGESGRESETLSIVPTTNGPLALAGAFTLHTSDGSTQHYAVKATLCRCGASGRKPFCDGSHRRVGFRSAPAAGETVQ